MLMTPTTLNIYLYASVNTIHLYLDSKYTDGKDMLTKLQLFLVDYL